MTLSRRDEFAARAMASLIGKGGVALCYVAEEARKVANELALQLDRTAPKPERVEIKDDGQEIRCCEDDTVCEVRRNKSYRAAEAFKAREMAKREASRPLADNEIRHVDGTVFELYRAERDGEVYAKRPHRIYIFKIGVSNFEDFEPGTGERVRAYYEASRPLKSNEWRGVVNGHERLAAFKWVDCEAQAWTVEGGFETYWGAHYSKSCNDGFRELHAALREWASKPENLPHHIAIVDGRPYVMKEDEFRLCGGEVSKCRVVIGTLVNAAPGQRERVEKWRASQGKVYLTVAERNARLDPPVYVSEKKPLGENELERLDGTREIVTTEAIRARVLREPLLFSERGELYPWSKYTRLNDSFVPGSVDRAKRIFARLYQFRDDEGVDAETGKLRTMAINEARHPETGEIVRLCVISSRGERSFGVSDPWCAVWEDHCYDGSSPFLTRCIAYRDHVLKLEKELEGLK